MDIEEFFESIDEKGFRCYAITGGGGKTSLMFALGRSFAARYRTLVTTTTKIKRPAGDECDSLTVGPVSELADAAVSEKRLIAAAASYLGPKLVGYEPEEIDRLAESGIFERIITEADGSRGLSLKAYEEWEPPVPGGTECHFVVLGADIFTAPLTAENVFRLGELSERHGIKRGESISVNKLAALLSNRREYLKNSPEGAFRILFINKCELLSESQLNNITSDLARNLPDYDMIVAASLNRYEVYKILPL